MSRSTLYPDNNIINEFDIVIPLCENLDDFNPEKCFEQYHFYELYDANKEYTKDIFEANYSNRGNHNYKYMLYVLADSNIFSWARQYYVTVTEMLVNEDKQYLIEHCQCDYHLLSDHNPLKLIVTPYFSGCVECEYPQQCVIDKTREYMNKKSI